GPVWRKAAELHRAAAGAASLTVWWRPPGGAARALAGATSAFPATVFEQVNPAMGDRVRAFAVDALGPVAGTRVWDLYAGIGEATAMLAVGGAVVESGEIDRRGVAVAAERLADGSRVTRHAGAAEDLAPTLGPADRVIANPPRAGIDSGVTN